MVAVPGSVDMFMLGFRLVIVSVLEIGSVCCVVVVMELGKTI